MTEQSEKEILTVVVENNAAEELFDYIYFKAKIDRPHGGIMFIHPLQASTLYELPDLPFED